MEKLYSSRSIAKRDLKKDTRYINASPADKLRQENAVRSGVDQRP